MTQTKIVTFKVLSRWRKKNSCHMWNSCCVNKLKLWHLSFHHNEALPKNLHFDGCKMCHIGNKNICYASWKKFMLCLKLKTMTFGVSSQWREKISCHVWNSCVTKTKIVTFKVSSQWSPQKNLHLQWVQNVSYW